MAAGAATVVAVAAQHCRPSLASGAVGIGDITKLGVEGLARRRRAAGRLARLAALGHRCRRTSRTTTRPRKPLTCSISNGARLQLSAKPGSTRSFQRAVAPSASGQHAARNGAGHGAPFRLEATEHRRRGAPRSVRRSARQRCWRRSPHGARLAGARSPGASDTILSLPPLSAHAVDPLKPAAVAPPRSGRAARLV
jgi:hypothetical protein